MKVGLLTTTLSRRGGGVQSVVCSLAHGMSELGCDVEVYGGYDDDMPEDRKIWRPIATREFKKWLPNSFGYMPGLIDALQKDNLDLVHVHGLWTYTSIASQKWSRRPGRKYIVSPHGMLDSWALNNSRWKKEFAKRFYEYNHLSESACLHALSFSEYESIRNYGLKNPVAVIPNGVDLPELSQSINNPEWDTDLPGNSKVLLFLSRLHPKKGLINLLRAWSIIKKKSPETASQWHLVIGGWEQGHHLLKLKAIVKKNALEGSVHFVGPQFYRKKDESHERADAFILPSFSEGMPIAVLAAWSYGLPVLMTPECHLADGFKENAAIEMRPNVESIVDALEKLFGMPDSERQLVGANGRKLVEEKYTSQAVTARMLEVYEWLLGKRQQPSCVITN